MPRHRPRWIRLLLLPQQTSSQPPALPQQDVFPARADFPHPFSRAPGHRGSRLHPACPLLGHQRARHRLHHGETRQLPHLRTPGRLRQRPQPAHRPPPHPAGPRSLQGPLVRHPRNQSRRGPTRPHRRNRRPHRINRPHPRTRTNPPGRRYFNGRLEPSASNLEPRTSNLRGPAALQSTKPRAKRGPRCPQPERKR